MSLRLRLTLLYSALLALTLIAFSAALYITVSRVTYGILEDTLAAEAKRLADPNRFQLYAIDYPAKRLAAPETYVQTRGFDGHIADRTANLGDASLPLADDGLRACQGGQAWTEIVPIDHGRLLVYSKPVYSHGGAAGIVQVARSLAEHDQSLGTLGSILTIGSSLVTIAAFGIGWVLAGAALRPINRVTLTAQAIGAERDFGRRVEYIGPNDEIGRLSTTFNAMLTELQAAYRQAEQSLQAQRRLVADASHELRTPLTTIRGNLELLRREPPIRADDRVAVLGDMVEECERLMRLVNDLLALARADAGRPLRIDVLPLKPLVEEVCRQARRLDSGRPIDTSGVRDVAVAANRDALKQVLLILLDNALKYTPVDGKISVEVTIDHRPTTNDERRTTNEEPPRGYPTENQEPARESLTLTRSPVAVGRPSPALSGAERSVVVRVRDTGAGIAPEALPHIFERFYRGDTARTGEGAGLGLSIARTLITAQHGTIAVESTPGRGTTVTLTLPQATTTPLMIEASA
jgi:two-component system, OmpR family, sensor kinase